MSALPLPLPLRERDPERTDECGMLHPPAPSENDRPSPGADTDADPTEERNDDCANPTDTGELHASEMDAPLTKLNAPVSPLRGSR